MTTMRILITDGRVVDPASGRDERADVAIDAGRIVAIGRAAPDFEPARRIDASGCIVMPGLVDLAARLREPGREHEGMLESELKAAAAAPAPEATSLTSRMFIPVASGFPVMGPVTCRAGV
jgi:dihydroorotase